MRLVASVQERLEVSIEFFLGPASRSRHESNRSGPRKRRTADATARRASAREARPICHHPRRVGADRDIAARPRPGQARHALEPRARSRVLRPGRARAGVRDSALVLLEYRSSASNLCVYGEVADSDLVRGRLTRSRRTLQGELDGLQAIADAGLVIEGDVEPDRTRVMRPLRPAVQSVAQWSGSPR